MRVLPLEPFGGDASDHEAGSARWNGATVSAVREAAVKLLPFKLNDVVWREDPELGPVGVGRARRGEVRVLVLVAELDAPRFVAGLERVARTLPEELVEQASLVVLTERVTPDVQGAVALVGPGIARVFLVEFDASESGAPKGSAAAKASGAATADAARADVPVAQVALPDAPVPAVVVAEVPLPDETPEEATAQSPDETAGAVSDETPSSGSHLTSARGRRRGRPAVPALAPSEQLGVVAGLVGEAELTLDGTEGQIRGVLSQDGLIEVAGHRYDDPLEAALAQGREVSDGWAAWRFGVEGPYLGEALEEALNPQRRAQRPVRRRAVRR